MQKGLVLKEMQVLPGPLNAIMNGLVSMPAGRTFQSLGGAGQIEMTLALFWLKTNLRNRPRFLKT